jgi:streptogramin lyase
MRPLFVLVAAPVLVGFLASVSASVLARASGVAPAGRVPQPAIRPATPAPLTLLPEGEEKRRFILDCTGCHQMDPSRMMPGGRPRASADWATAIHRMLGYAGANSGFPVISNYREAYATAAWLESNLRGHDAAPAVEKPAALRFLDVEVTEFAVSTSNDLPHDVAIDARGQVVITGMMTHRMLVLDPATGSTRPVPIPAGNANPRAVELDSAGNWWVVLGAPQKLARYTPSAAASDSGTWDMFDVGFYAHSVALGGGRAWVNGHFTRAPETIASVHPGTRAVSKVELPSHPTLGSEPGGPIPYEIRVAPNGVVWMSELSGNRLVAHDPRTGAQRAITMPEPHMGPRRFDIDGSGVLWVPAYAANALVRIDPSKPGPGAMTVHRLPIADMLPYVVRVEPSGRGLWIGTGTTDIALRFDFATNGFEAVQLPGSGVLIRHLAIDPRTRDVWLAYGASPGTQSRVARLRSAAR